MQATEQIESPGGLSRIESYFDRYSDVPREVILKQDLLRGGHWFTDAALEAASQSLVKSYRLFSYDLMPMTEMKRKEHRKIPEWFTIRGGDYGLRPVTVQTTLDSKSPYVIDVVDGQLKLLLKGREICNVSFPKPLKYYARKFEDGTAYHEIIAYGYFVTVFRNCQYWGPDEECRFCDININARQMKELKDFTFNAPVKPVASMVEVARSIEQDATEEVGFPPPIDFIITGGTILKTLHGKDEDTFYLEYASALKWGGRRRYINLQTNAKDKEAMKRYRAAGVDCHHANMEVWDRKLFDWINPGKSRRVGWDNWVKWMVESVDVFGETNVRPNFVCGLEMAKPYGFATVKEAVKSTTEGMDFMMRHGVFPRFNQWRREPGSNLVSEHPQPSVPLELTIELMRNYYEIWKKYGLPIAHHNGAHPEARVMGRGHGTYDDIILLNERPDYESRVDRGIQEGLKGCVVDE
ncbi:MAG: radical SAM protein [Candidatus Binatia bacterium]|nr:radical SAM protein [Candidatus Binatia bacterium]